VVLDPFNQGLAVQAQAILETSPEIINFGSAGGHVHNTAGTVQVMCTVDPFGTDPPDATSAGQVHWVYALHLCVIGTPGTPWDYATKTSGPVAVRLDGVPTVRLPAAGNDYRGQVREIIPARYQTQAFGSFAHPQLVAALRARYNATVASTRG
jgi:hypothetical protein